MRKPTILIIAGYIAVRFTPPKGKRVALFGFGKEGDVMGLKLANRIADLIFQDWLDGRFDASQNRYRVKPPQTKSNDKDSARQNLALNQINAFEKFIKDLEVAQTSHLAIILRNLTLDWSNTWLVVSKDDYATSTYNKVLQVLRRFENYYLNNNFHQTKLYSFLKNKKKTLKDKENYKKRDPLTLEEIKSILDFCLNPTSDNENLNSLARHYYPYIALCVYTGLRPSEAIGLRYKDFDFQAKTFLVEETLTRVRLHTSGSYTRTRQLTKCGESKTLPIPDCLYEWIATNSRQHQSEDLIFTNPSGRGYLDDLNFRERFWKPLLQHLRIRYRVPYALRHSFASHCLAQGIPITEVAQMLGHSSLSMLATRYAHSLNNPKLPDY